jgi:hypothetical protein
MRAVISRLTGASVRALIVAVLVVAPSVLLPGISQGAAEITIVLSIIAAAFVIFEYGFSFPSLIEFRFAAPYNRIRFLTLAVLVLSLVLLSRSVVENTPATEAVSGFAEMWFGWLNFPYSPVRFVVDQLGGGDADQMRMLGLAASLGLAIVLLAQVIFALLLWLFSWPATRENFNLWVNLPNFDPTAGPELERRLKREIMISFFVGVSLPFLAPVLASRASGWFDPSSLSNFQTLVWMVTLWAFFPATSLMRSIALMKIVYLIRRAREA